MRTVKRIWMLSLLGCVLAGAPAVAQEVLFDNGEPDLWSAIDVRRYMPADDFVLPGEAGETVQVTEIQFWVWDDGAFNAGCENPLWEMNCWTGVIEYAIFEDVEKPDLEPTEQNPEGTSLSFLKRAPGAEPLLFESVDINVGDAITVEATGRIGDNDYLPGFLEYRVTFEPQAPIELQAGTPYWLGLHLADNFGPKNWGLYWATSREEYRPGWCAPEYLTSEGNMANTLDGGEVCEVHSDCDVVEEGDGLGYCNWSQGSFEQREAYSLEERAALLTGHGSLKHVSTQDLFENFNDAPPQAQQLAFNLVPEPAATLQALTILTVLGSTRRRRSH